MQLSPVGADTPGPHFKLQNVWKLLPQVNPEGFHVLFSSRGFESWGVFFLTIVGRGSDGTNPL